MDEVGRAGCHHHYLKELLGHVCATLLVDNVGSSEHDLEGDEDEDE